MDIKGALAALRGTQPRAPSELEQLSARLDELSEAVDELRAENETVLERVRSWSAREAAKRRHEATKNLDALISEPEGGALDPEATSGQGGADDISSMNRAAAKAAIARKLRGHTA